MRSTTERGMRCRFAFAAILLGGALAALGVRLALLHLTPSEDVRVGINDARTMERELLAPRGSIYDCSGRRNILALNVAAEDVCADPRLVHATNAFQTVTRALAGALGMERAEVADKLGRPEKQYACVRKRVLPDTADQIRAMNIPGVFFEDATVRHYPHQSFLCHVLGFVNDEGVGSAGVEQFMDTYLRGTPGSLKAPVNGLRQEIRAQREREIRPLRGADVFLTVDQNVQYIVERALEDAVREHGAKGAWAIMQRVKTGEILAMASRPSYDPNEFRDARDSLKLNRAIGYVYEPGSTMKAVTISAALNEGTVTPATVFDCEQGAWTYANRVLHDFHSYGQLTVADGVKKSSNILTAKVGLTLGNQRLYRYMRDFGVGSALGLDLPGEEGGILRPVKTWCAVDPTRVAIGQSVAVTALQMLGVICAIANDGCLMRPYIVSSVSRPDSGVLAQREPRQISRPIRADTAAVMRHLLARVTEDGGTGTRARVEGFDVGGKTGTAQKPLNGGYADAYVASFVGFLPVSDPEIGLIVVVDEPEPEHTGGVVAAPVFARIASQAVRCLDIAPSRPVIVASDRGQPYSL